MLADRETRHSATVVTFMNVAHATDHFFMLIFPTAVLAMEHELGLGYGELLSLALGGFIAFGAGSIPAGWLGDRWSRRNMMAVFFLGIGAASIATGFTTTTLGLAIGLTVIGLMAAIYHPVGTAMLAGHARQLGRAIGTNAVWGNMGVASAAFVTGALVDAFSWRMAFIAPGVVAMLVGIAFLARVPESLPRLGKTGTTGERLPRSLMVRVFAVLIFVTLANGVVFNAITVSLPKAFDERVALLVQGGTFGVGALVAIVYVIGATSQVIIGRLIDRHSLKSVFVPLALLPAPCLLLATFAEGWVVVGLVAVAVFGVFGQVTINDSMVARYTADAWRSRAYAVRYLVSFGASGIAVPLIAALHGFGDRFATAYLALAGFALLVFLGAIAFPGSRDAGGRGVVSPRVSVSVPP